MGRGGSSVPTLPYSCSCLAKNVLSVSNQPVTLLQRVPYCALSTRFGRRFGALESGLLEMATDNGL